MKRKTGCIALIALAAALAAGPAAGASTPWTGGEAGSELKPLNSITADVFYAGEDLSFIPDAEGLQFRKGLNLIMFADGGFAPWKNAELRYTLRQDANGRYAKGGLQKLYLKQYVGIFSITLGKDSESIGPGAQALLLSNNAAPMPMLRVKTERPLLWHGKWDIDVVNAWLDDPHRPPPDRKDPRVFVGRLGWAPSDLLTLGLTRGEEYGGAGRPDYWPWEFPELLLGKHENQPGNKYDADGYLAYDVSLNLPARLRPAAARSLKVYYERACTDINPSKQFYWPFEMTLNAYLGGVVMDTGRQTFRLEFLMTPRLFYVHHWYPVEGYTYGGMSMGAPYGTQYRSLVFTHDMRFSGGRTLGYRATYLKQMAYPKAGMERWALAVYASRPAGRFTLAPYAGLDYAVNQDPNPLPTVTAPGAGDHLYLTTGLSTTLKF